MEPTRQQIKEAFKKTIERWERIVEDVSYFERSSCDLCPLFSNCSESKACPIVLYTKGTNCRNTPYINFHNDKTPANALPELNFLRKVYIWWVEKEKDDWGIGVVRAREEEKKEEYENVTKEIRWEVESEFSERGSLVGTHNGVRVVVATNRGIERFFDDRADSYKVEHDSHGHIVLKKA